MLKSILMASAMTMAFSGAAMAQNAAQPKIIGDVRTDEAAARDKCGRSHAEGVSGCTHNRRLSRSTIAAWTGDSDAGNEPEMKLIDEGKGIFHDQFRSMVIEIRPATAKELDTASNSPSAVCSAKIAGPVGVEKASQSHHRRRRSRGSCHWAYHSSEGSH